MLSKNLPPELRNLKIARHPILVMGLVIAGLSLAANIGYWTRGLSGQTYWINFVFAGMVEVIFVFLIWLGGNIWKSGGRALAIGLICLSLAPWLASSVSNFMFLSTLKDPQLSSAKSAVIDAREQVLTADLTRYANELSQYSDVVRKDVQALEDRREFCNRAPREECSSSDLADEIAVNRKINQLEANQATALNDLEALASERSTAIKESEFSLLLFQQKFGGNWLSREFLMVAFLDILKAVLFLVGLWINLRLFKADETISETQQDQLAELDKRIAELRSLEKSIDEKSAAFELKKKKAVKAQAKTATVAKTNTHTPEQVSKPVSPPKPKQADEKQSRPSSTIEFKERRADGSTVTRRKSIA